MKKKILRGFVILAIATVTAFNISININQQNGISVLALANIEALALANIEVLSPSETSEGTKCLPGETPDRYLISSEPQMATYTSNSNGQITVGGQILGGYQKNTTVTITVETFNCHGQQQGSCCDQSKVGTQPI